jgi:hypothetical protein
MRISRLNRSITSWLATFAILMAALAPAISHAVVALSDGELRWVEVCTVGGVKQVPVIDADRADDPGSHGERILLTEHCPYCATHCGSFALAAPVAVGVSTHVDPAPFPSAYLHAPRPSLFAWSASSPRAPPARA